MDILSDILNHLNLETSLYFRTDLSAPWGVQVPSYRNVARFHIALTGTFFVELEGESPIEVSSGDIVLIPHGRSHIIKSALDSPVIALDDVLRLGTHQPGQFLQYGEGEGERTQLVCGHFSFEEESLHPLPKSLPGLLHVEKSDSSHQSWMASSLDFIDLESKNSEPGSSAVVNKLSEIILIQAIRHYMRENRSNTLFLAALSDKYIRRSIEEIHAAPATKWKLEDLARSAGLSRTIYAERFQKLTGTTPMHYVTSWRMERARRLLQASEPSVDQIAELVGYSATEAFQRRFKKLVGITPSAYRRKHR